MAKPKASGSKKSPAKSAAALAPAALPAPTPPTPPLEPDFPVVGIGASAGGLAAIEEFLAALPSDGPLGMAFVLVQHLDPDHKSILLELVKRYTKLEVEWATDGTAIRPEHLYILPPNKDIALVAGCLTLMEPEAARGLRLPIDADELRRHAEEMIDSLSVAAPGSISAEDTLALLHELAVHQIELEMRNEELRTAQQDLDEQREKYCDLFDMAPVGYLTLSDAGVVADANLTAALLLGVERQVLVGQPFSAFVATEDRDEFYRYVLAVTRSGASHRCELRLRRMVSAEGAERGHFWARLESRPRPGTAGDLVYAWVTFTDIEELVEERDALRQSESRFAGLFEQAPLGYQSLDEDGSFLAVSEMWLQTLGYAREEVIGRWFGDFLAPEFVEGFRERFPKFKARSVMHSEFEMMHKNGSRRTIAFEGRIGHNPDGSFQKTHCMLANITERKHAAEALRESEEKFKFLWDCSVVAKSLTLPTGEADMNDAFLDLLGYTREELADKPTWQQLSHPDDLVETQRQVDALLSGERESARFEKRYLHKDGHVIWADLSTSLRRDAAGEPMYFMTTILDITERKRLELELHHRLTALTQPPSEGRRLEFSDVFDLEQIQIIQDAFSDATGVASLLVDLEGRPITEPSNFRRLCGDVIRGTEVGLARCQASDAGLAKFNASGPTILPCLSCGLWDASASISVGGEHIANWLVGQVRNEQQSEAAMAAYAAEIGADVDEFMAAFAEVPTMPIEQFEKVARSLYMLAQQISIIAYQNVQQARFITEREATRRDLADKEAMLTFAQQTAHVGNWVWHVQTDRLEWSDEMYRIFDIAPGEFTGDLAGVVARAIHPDDRAAVEEINRAVAEEGRPRPLEYRIVRADGSVRHVYAEAGRLEHDPEGNPLRLTGIVADITDRKQAENALRERTEELERSNEELQRFAYVASHDLREPLRMVTSYTQLLRKRYAGQLDADADDFIGYAVDGAARMDALIQDLLAYSRVGSHGHELTATDLGPVLDGVLKGLEVAIDEAGATVTFDEMPTVVCDAPQVGQLFQNLVSNSLKFHRDELMRIHIGVERAGHEWVFSVKDNGLGIDAEYFDRIFVIFQRLQPRDDYEGSGMGLAICKRIVERHRGRIWVESVPGEGSTFFFSLRAQ